VIAEDYIRQVEWALRDLPWSERRDLVADLRHHLAELPAMTDLVARLGSPGQYAADLRAAEDLERRHGFRAYLRARRPRNVILVTALVVVLALAIGLAIAVKVYVDRYQPLHWAGGTSLPLTAKSDPYEAGYTVYFRKGKPFQYGMLIENDGRFAVRVLGATAPGYAFPVDTFPPWVAGHLLMSKSQSAAVDRRFERFHPFDMQPGSFRVLLFNGVFRCNGVQIMGRQDALTYSDFFVRFSFLWKTATADIPIDQPLHISFAKEGCGVKR